MIKVVFFAALREQLDCSELTVNSKEISTIAELKLELASKSEQWGTLFNNTSLLSAVNHDMVDSTHQINSGDEVAFFPPVTGG